MDITGKKVALLVHDYFEQAEFEEPLRALKDAGAEVSVITTADSKQLHGLQHVAPGDPFTADLFLKDATSNDYDALVLPGGAINVDHLRMNETAQEWVRDFLDNGRPVAAICHAPWLLVSADVVDGRELTSYYTIQDDITNAGGEWVDREVVTDDNLITSRKPDDLPAFNDALITMVMRRGNDLLGAPIAKDEHTEEADARLRSLGYDRRRDNITPNDERDLLAEEDETDPDELRPSRVVSGDERDGTE